MQMFTSDVTFLTNNIYKLRTISTTRKQPNNLKKNKKKNDWIPYIFVNELLICPDL